MDTRVKPAYDDLWLWVPAFAGTTDALHPGKTHALAVRKPRGDIAGREAGFALRHLFLRAAQGLPPRRAMRRARQRSIDDLLDLFEAEHEFQQLLPFQIIAQRVVVVHGILKTQKSGAVLGRRNRGLAAGRALF